MPCSDAKFANSAAIYLYICPEMERISSQLPEPCKAAPVGESFPLLGPIVENTWLNRQAGMRLNFECKIFQASIRNNLFQSSINEKNAVQAR
ncbi:unnamed protein product [Protopolystoma xenopodis]|uniref:Uncharacterized protein n=1 Tax=Protopolystoma xenopodis TaxID=117903 RepID=A0A448XIM4_9PLAT|nr:unnamed protein product [Protopolystoma xenopodis]